MKIEFSTEELKKLQETDKFDMTEEKLNVLRDYENIDLEEIKTKFDWKEIQAAHIVKQLSFFQREYDSKVKYWNMWNSEEKHPYGERP